MGKRKEIEVTKDQFEKAIYDLGLAYSEPYDYVKTDDGYVFDDYWYDESTGLTLAHRFNGYRDDPKSVPRYFLDEGLSAS
jgi:hypothetical protein